MMAYAIIYMFFYFEFQADLYAGAVFIEQALKWDLYAAICLLLGIAALFTITGMLICYIL